MSLPSIPTAFANVRATARTGIKYPFIELGDASAKVYTMRCSVLRDSYNAAQVALDTPMTSAANAGVISLPFAADAGAYYCGDFNHSVKDGRMLEFDRVFATIPATRSNEFNGSTSYTYPQVVAGGTAQDYTISSINLNGVGPGQVRIVCNEPTDDLAPSVNYTPQVYLTITTNDGVGGDDVDYSGYHDVAQQIDNDIIVDSFPFESNLVSGVLGLRIRATPQLTANVSSFVDKSYYLPGVSAGISSASQIPFSTPFTIQKLNGDTTTRVYSTATIPTDKEYELMRARGDYLIVTTKIQRYMGNIIERIDQKVIAR